MRRWWWGQIRRPCLDVGVAAFGPRGVVVGVAQARRDFAVHGGAAAVAHAHRQAHRFGVEAAFAADVEDLASAAEDHRDDACAAGQPAGFGRGDAAAGVEGAHPGGVELGHQLVQGHRHHDRGATATGPGQVLRLDGLEELGERDAVADRGGQVGVDPATARSPAPAARAGEEIARIILVSICPCRAGRRNRPWQVPSSSSHIVNVVRRSASASSRSSARPSNSSARSGAITSKTRRPRTRNAFASWWAASSTRCASAAARCSAETANCPVRGSRSNDATIARPCARLTRPAAIAAARTSMLLDLLREPEVGAGLAAYLPGLGRDPVRRGAGTGLDRGLDFVRRRRAAAGRARRAAPGLGRG